MSGLDPRPLLRTPAFLWAPVVFLMAAIFVASSIPDLGGLPGGMSDKSGHGLAYALLGAALLRDLAHGRLRGVTWPRAAAAVALTTLYGASDELHQWFVPGRSPDALDVFADFLGAAFAVSVAGAARACGILKRSPHSRT